MVTTDKVVIQATPHIKLSKTTKGIMLDVIIALLPSCIAGCIFFKWRALLILSLSVIFACLTEIGWRFAFERKKKEIFKEFDFTSIVTGLLLGMSMSCDVEWYVPVVSAIFAVGVVKMIFGGTGRNIVNPALAGRVFAFISFTAVGGMATYKTYGQITAGATTLTHILQTSSLENIDLFNLFIGINLAGCIGETCKLTIIAGGLYLVIRRVIDIRWPLIYIVVCGLMTSLLYKDINVFMPSILTGGLLIGAFFMSTDYVTSPCTSIARYVYYVLLGILTAILRKATQMETVSFSILIMNLLIPLIERFIYPRHFGAKSIFAKKEKEGKQ